MGGVTIDQVLGGGTSGKIDAPIDEAGKAEKDFSGDMKLLNDEKAN